VNARQARAPGGWPQPAPTSATLGRQPARLAWLAAIAAAAGGYLVATLGAGETVAGLLGMVVLVWLPRAFRVRRLRWGCFDHVNDLVKAEAYRARQTARVKALLDWAQLDLDQVVYGGHRPNNLRRVRAAKYVHLTVAGRLWPRLDDIQAVTIRWSPLADALADDFLDKLTRKVAQFLATTPGQLEHAVAARRRRVHFTRRPSLELPARLDATTELPKEPPR